MPAVFAHYLESCPLNVELMSPFGYSTHSTSSHTFTRRNRFGGGGVNKNPKATQSLLKHSIIIYNSL
ncbi:hypothetical protein RSOLAG1IB_10724 [Rhizoctonia solani AG-1 IB]|uniref:Uncharacterized protein n=1 Tax=Thanatephorus cucumeris (strain AG1-IB / isolate 7/3/14) TaxID=1108050 RepID=A0A0B7G4F8_THACB|nr:hypothetical protein RSOLAG1IB_10724 [Rhizoctonia solani AG-1 IB]